jgi:hypothetical protein
MLYLLLGILFGWSFWELCERYAARGLMYINPLVFMTMLVWGSSGLFPLRFFPENRFSSILQFFYTAVPDWDILLYSWTSWSFLTHRSFLFSSNILPATCIGAIWLLSSFRKLFFSSTRSALYFLSLNISIGLSVGVAAHLLADVLQNLVLFGKDLLLFLLPGDYPYRSFKFEIGNKGLIESLIWVGLNLALGLIIPFLIIKSTSLEAEGKYHK